MQYPLTDAWTHAYVLHAKKARVHTNYNDILCSVRRVVAEIMRLRPSTVSYTADVIADIGMDSDDFSFLLVPLIHERFGVRTDALEWAEHPVTLERIATLVMKYRLQRTGKTANTHAATEPSSPTDRLQ
jgi:hypothetical protein